jgi:hypothetical protein
VGGYLPAPRSKNKIWIVRDRCRQNSRDRFEGGLDSGNALPRVRRFRLIGKKPAKEPAVKKRSDATCGAHFGKVNIAVMERTWRCQSRYFDALEVQRKAHRLSEDGYVFPLANLSSEPTVKPTACAKTTSKNVDVATFALSRDLLFLLSLRTTGSWGTLPWQTNPSP